MTSVPQTDAPHIESYVRTDQGGELFIVRFEPWVRVDAGELIEGDRCTIRVLELRGHSVYLVRVHAERGAEPQPWTAYLRRIARIPIWA